MAVCRVYRNSRGDPLLIIMPAALARSRAQILQADGRRRDTTIRIHYNLLFDADRRERSEKRASVGRNVRGDESATRRVNNTLVVRHDR